ncbi:putative DNA-directed polymerase kappa [Taphrina deformans PYCC 5710]|uniref:DNA polymerase kappa n=1 Tax=Taphrina deformans (strain PYCC 5710 / ATCC 11124 / CBS 356.35 / IMI 108563 / JCM 9778 / NBRC 8474) TaxID=1097556 RepID=R4XFG9_TAPDE|nr:putative DNA-directed polymerase kappa [Taphrina deformans PYCC 5710]|eukprot:CCG82072.1 putative DNA-directed polymerase kappa [Taphrina deformans PYCC 5710]
MQSDASDYGSDQDFDEVANTHEDEQILSQVLEEPVRKRLKLDETQRADLAAFKKQEIDIDTLRKRLAGPSVNQIIYKASEGSKYFNNEKKKDTELTDKIARTQAKARAILERTQELAADERRIDEKIASIEASIDLSQYIMHIDCDAFYASVEELDRPELKDVPMGVGIGVLTTANYAARKFGVRSAMPTYIAKKLCPELVCVPLNFEKYIQKAQEIRAILAKADPDYQAASLDEAYLNMTKYIDSVNLSPDQAVEELRDEIHRETGLTVSAGIAANNRLAKIGSNQNKPNGQFRLPNDRRAILEFMSELPVRKVNGIGKVFERQLEAVGVKKCKDIYTYRALLSKLFGQKSFDFLLGVYLGTGSTNIKPPEDHERKSIGTETTFRQLSDPTDLKEKLQHIAEELQKDCERANWAGRTLHLKIKKHTYEVYTRQRSLPRSVYLSKDLFEFALPLLEKELPLNLRLMGLRLTQLTHINKKPVSNFFEGFGFDTSKFTSDDTNIRNALFTTEDEEFLEGDTIDHNASHQSEPWVPGSDSVFKQLKKHEKQDNRAVEKDVEAAGADQAQCPICSRRITGSDEAISIHIDSCLNSRAIRDALQEDRADKNKQGHNSLRRSGFLRPETTGKSSPLKSWLSSKQ